MTEEQVRRWEHWATSRQNLIYERLCEVILGVETGRVQQAEEEHRRACEAFVGEQASLATRRS